MPQLTVKSQVTLPKNIRSYLGVDPGEKVEFIIQKNKVVVQKVKNTTVLEQYTGYLGKHRTANIMKELR